MAYIPYTQETGAIYTLTGPRGDTAVFNDPTNANYVGMLTDLSGLDSAGVRESGGPMTGADGGWHGNFYYDRRTITLSGTVFGHAGANARATRIDRMVRACDALRNDAVLSWQPMSIGAPVMQTWVRRQQPLRVTGAWNKDFQLQLVSQYAQLFSATLHQSSTVTSPSAENQGSMDSMPSFTIQGASSGTISVSLAGGGTLTMLGSLTLAGGDVLVVDVASHTATKNGTNANSFIDFSNTSWSGVAMPRATTSVYTVHNAPSMFVKWRDWWV